MCGFELKDHNGNSKGFTKDVNLVTGWIVGGNGTAMIGERGNAREKLYFMGSVKTVSDLLGLDAGLYFIQELSQYRVHLRNGTGCA